jgi:hypothetical protein
MIRRFVCIILATLAMFAAVSAFGQTATFTFGPIPSGQTCASNLTWNGAAVAYPGNVCFNLYPSPWSSIAIPQNFGFPNDGYLQDCYPTIWGPQNWTSGNQTTAGSTFTQTVAFGNCYDGGNTTVDATVDFVVLAVTGRFGHKFYFNVITDGKGTVAND